MTVAKPFESLAALGWNDFFEAHYQQFTKDPTTSGQQPARIIGEERGLFSLAVARDTFLGSVAGRLRYFSGERLDLPAVGDWVLCSRADHSARAIIHSILPRQTCITRKQAGNGIEDQILAANVDRALIVTSANAEFNLARLQRYLTAVRDSGVAVEIVLSKVDLYPDYPALLDQVKAAVPNVVVTGVSAVSRVGLEEFQRRLIPGHTFVVLGSSGVGKSTLLNCLMGQKIMATSEISDFEDKGRHTTSARHLFALSMGVLVIDTPGLREFRLGGFEQGLHETYEDIVALSAKCKFSDCSHQNEPGCAVKESIESGLLAETRWSWYVKLQKEVDYQKRKESGDQAGNSKARWKKIHKLAKQISKRKKWEF